MFIDRKTPNLRLCFGEKNEVPWFKEMESENIDFKVRLQVLFQRWDACILYNC